MDNFLNKENVKIFSLKLYEVLNNLIPGIFTLEIFFKKGLFSSSPSTIFDFILYGIWAFTLSLPFNLLTIFSVERLVKKAIVEVEKLGIYEKNLVGSTKKMKRNRKIIDSMLQFMTINMSLFFIFFTNKFLVFHYVYESIWGINKSVLVYLNTMLIYPLFLLALWFIGNWIENRMAKKIVKDMHSS